MSGRKDYIVWTTEMKEYIKQNYKNKTGKQLCEELNLKFGINCTDRKLLNIKHDIKEKENFVFEKIPNSGCFKKGQTSWNKGKKGVMKANSGSFKKGNAPYNHREVGEERITKDGYIEVKIAEPNVWELKQRHIYNQYHKNLKDDEIVTFLDGDKTNLDINNLVVITREENAYMNKNQLRCENAEINKTSIMLAKMKTTIKEKKKK